MDAPSAAYGKSNWAAAIAHGASQNLTADEFQTEFEELGARKMANQLRLDDQPKATRLKAAQEQKALVDRHFATSDLANLDLMEATASLEAGYYCLYVRKSPDGVIDIVASDRTDQNVLETTLAKQAVRAKPNPNQSGSARSSVIRPSCCGSRTCWPILTRQSCPGQRSTLT